MKVTPTRLAENGALRPDTRVPAAFRGPQPPGPQGHHFPCATPFRGHILLSLDPPARLMTFWHDASFRLHRQADNPLLNDTPTAKDKNLRQTQARRGVSG